ncbi:hypothetical protein DMC25_06745 [Caulobacter sp. D4A]|nr:hypothetical protein DMC18_15060 [Caulobacter sp. D5]PXA90922.1 hypothetical protein DMC25_06745 [Caulobacter sp. D4A]
MPPAPIRSAESRWGGVAGFDDPSGGAPGARPAISSSSRKARRAYPGPRGQAQCGCPWVPALRYAPAGMTAGEGIKVETPYCPSPTAQPPPRAW